MPQLPTTKLSTKKDLRDRRHTRVRALVTGTAERPRLAFSKSNKFVQVQVIDDVAGRTLAAAHGRAGKGKKNVSLSKQAEAVGAEIATKAKAVGVTSVVFDRGGFSYVGQVKALAEAARAGGLTF
jgi:large subunit ribosomal protein L18